MGCFSVSQTYEGFQKISNDILLGTAEISDAKIGEKLLGKDIECTKVFAGIKKNEEKLN